MRNEVPDPDEAEELKELIRIKIDIYGLTKEDVEYLRARAKEIMKNDRQT
jgi:hypothetical protein